MQGRQTRVRVYLLPLALLVGAFAVPSQALAASGTIEVCKQGQDGVTGNFQFQLNGGAAFTVPVGGCSGPMTTRSGRNTVSEVAPSDGSISVVDIAVRPARSLRSSNLATRTAVVRVARNSTVANETLVTFTNGRPAGLVKVCKVAGDSALLGDSFSFTLNGGPAFSVAAGAAPAGNCSATSQFAIGTIINVHELPTAGTFVSSIVVSDGRGSGIDPANGNATVTIAPGVTTVTYTNRVVVQQPTGFIEVCKEASDSFTTGVFHFTIAGNGVSIGRDVAVGQCSEPIQVPSGDFTVTEAASGSTVVTDIEASPANRLLGTNLINRTATVHVVASSDSSDETLVTFFNAQQTGQFKVCKTLAANSGALSGTTFTFDISASTGLNTTLGVVAGAAGTTTCRLFPTALPFGATVSITEESRPNVQITGVSVSPASRDNGSFGDTANLTIGSGITTATFSNQALGTIEVCKLAADPSTASQTFQFTINGGAAISVHAGQCSPAIQVPAGTATVRELAKANFTLVSVSANDGRLQSSPTTNPATVSVPFGGVDNETVVSFTNRVNTGQFKLCKQSPELSLQGVPFTFTFSYQVNNEEPVTGSVSLTPGQCSSLSADIPVVDQNGNAISVSVLEAPTPTVAVSSIVLAGAGHLTSSNLAAGTATFTVGQGINILTYTNVRTPVGGAAAKLLRL